MEEDEPSSLPGSTLAPYPAGPPKVASSGTACAVGTAARVTRRAGTRTEAKRVRWRMGTSTAKLSRRCPGAPEAPRLGGRNGHARAAGGPARGVAGAALHVGHPGGGRADAALEA